MRIIENVNFLIKEKEKGVKCLKFLRLSRYKIRELVVEVYVVKFSKELVDKLVNKGFSFGI